MSSATSTESAKGSVRAKAEATSTQPTKPEGSESPVADQSLRPWHFFVLVSLAAATAAVVMSRQAAPEHLVLISLTIGAAGAAAAAFYGALVPLTAADATLFSERQSARARTALEREKALVLRSIKELEFDRAMGKVSPHDFDEMSARLRARAMMLIRQADEGGAGYRELIERELSARLVTSLRTGNAGQQPVARVSVNAAEGGASALRADAEGAVAVPRRQCAACSTGNDVDAAFCKRCGLPLDAASAS